MWALDGGMTYHFLFVMPHKSAPMLITASSFSALLRSYYSGLSSASPFLQTVVFAWNAGYPMRIESPSDYVHAIENSAAQQCT